MESLLLGFKEEPNVEDDAKSSSSSSARRLVPWLSWDEWISVKDSLFSDSPDSVSSALKRISAWRSRGCLPVLVEVTASIIEIQQKDPWFRVDQWNDASLSEEMLAMLYCMAIMRLVNCVVEKTRKRELISIAVAADAIGIPRMLIDVRHEGSHRELPSLKVVQSASIKALDWLKSYYWEPQNKAIPFQGEGNAKVKKEIKSKIREVAICLKVSGSPHSSASLVKGKRPKKQITKILKSILLLYSSFSSEIVSVLLEYLLKVLSSSVVEENADDASVGLTAQNVLADWKRVIIKLWNKEPELVLNLLKTILDMIKTEEDMKCEGDNPCVGISHLRGEFRRSHYLSSLFAWLVGILGKAPSAAGKMPKRVSVELVRKCLLISRLCNKQLVDSALHLAELMDDSSLLERLRKVSLVGLSNLDNAGDDSSSLSSSKNIFQIEKSMHEAAKKLKLVKLQIMKNKNLTVLDCEIKKPQMWSLAKSWNPCPIGMLPGVVGSSGVLPVLDIIDNQNLNQASDNENSKIIEHGAKRDATMDLQLLDNSTVKKMRETCEFNELNDALQTEGGEGCVLEGGVWKRVMEEELLAIKSSVKILV